MEDFLEFEGPVVAFGHASSRGKDDAANLRVTCPIPGNEKRQAASLKFNNTAIRSGLADAKICFLENKGKMYLIRSTKETDEKLKTLIQLDRLKQINMKGTIGSFHLVEILTNFAKFTPEEHHDAAGKAYGFHLYFNIGEGVPCPYGVAFELTQTTAFASTEDEDEPETGEVQNLNTANGAAASPNDAQGADTF